MKIYKTQKEFEAEIKKRVFVSQESIDITNFSLDVKERIEVAGNINAGDIKAWDIKAGDINAEDINAGNINAGDIKAWDIKAKKVDYYAVAFAYKNIKVKSIKGRRGNAKHFVLDGKLEVEEK